MAASELAEMGVCERRMWFSSQLGPRRSREQLQAAARGTRAHAEFLHDALALDDSVDTSERVRGRCFIATTAYGEGAETEALRQFRDRVLRPTWFGRRLIVIYYRIAPRVCVAMRRAPWLACVARAALLPAVVIAKAIARRHVSRTTP